MPDKRTPPHVSITENGALRVNDTQALLATPEAQRQIGALRQNDREKPHA